MLSRRMMTLIVSLISTHTFAQQTTSGLSEPIYNESITESYRIPTAFGTIYGEVIRPVVPEGVTVPVILTYSPYNILSSPSNQAASIAADGTASYYVPRGYARAKFDLVGTRESSGCYDYGGIAEQETGRDVINFLGTQNWSNGRVGMVGGSYDGTTQWAAAIAQPEHLTTIVPQVAIDRWYDYAYGGGIRYFLNENNPSDEGFDTPLAFDFGFGFLLPLDPTDPQHYLDAASTRIAPCEAITHTMRAYEEDPIYDAFWDERDYRARAHLIQASVLVEGGWLDHNVKHWGSTRMFMALPDEHPKKMVIGQWPHSPSRFPDATEVRHAWFDYWLLGLETGVMDLPRVDTESSDGVRWQQHHWPPAAATPHTYRLDGSEDAASLALTNSNTAQWTDNNPALTERQIFGLGCGTACLMFESEPLNADLRIAGSPALTLNGSSDSSSSHLVPVLYELTSNGQAEIITRGFLNLLNRNGLDQSEPLIPGDPWQATVEFWDVDWTLKTGNRLGLALMSANAAWALPDTIRATTTLKLDQSQLVLPLIELGQSESMSESRVQPTRTGGSFNAFYLLFLGLTGLVLRARKRS